MESCESCNCYVSGQCRRHAPTPQMVPAAVYFLTIPTVSPAHWCAEFRERSGQPKVEKVTGQIRQGAT